MIKLKCFLCIISLFIALPYGYASQKDGVAKVITGYKYGTNISLARDMQLVSSLDNHNLGLISSKGGIENLYSILEGKQSSIAFIEEFYLDYLKKKHQIATVNKLRLIAPLHDSEIHILARKHIQSIDDLKGAKVSIDVPESSSYLISKALFKSLNIKIQTYNLSPAEALNTMKEGNLDALVYVSGAPVRLFEENITKDDELHLLEIPYGEGNISKLENKVIKGNSYSWQARDVNTKSTKMLLMSIGRNQLSNCVAVRGVYNAVLNNLDFLKNYGHLKWGEIALNIDKSIASIPVKRRYPCSY